VGSALVVVGETPEVRERWRAGEDLRQAIEEDFAEPDPTGYVIETDRAVDNAAAIACTCSPRS
jgi:hypothetical protein